MNNSFSTSFTDSETSFVRNNKEIDHNLRRSELNLKRFLSKQKKLEPISEITTKKLSFVENEWKVYKTTKNKGQKIVFPEAKNKNFVYKKNCDELIKLASFTSQLFDNKNIEANKRLKNNLNQMILTANHGLKKNR